MAKRPRGKQAKALEERAKARQKAEEVLKGSSFSGLDLDDEGTLHSDQEQDYETRPRKFQIQEEDASTEGLPVKTLSGEIKRVKRKAQPAPKKEEEEEVESESEESEQEEAEKSESEDEEEVISNPKLELEKLNQAKERIAEINELLTEDPEDHIGKLRELRDMLSRAKFFKVKQILLLSLVRIFRGIVPGYRIRPLTEAEKKETKLTKDVKRLRYFEETLLANYHEYITTLTDFTKKGRGTQQGTVKYLLASTAINCACELLTYFPYFNFQADLLKILMEKISHKRVDKPFVKCMTTIESIFKQDEEGQVSFEIVRMMSKMIKARHYKVDPSLLTSLLDLRLLTELSVKADLDKVDKAEGPKLKKKDRVHLSKKERKARKERKEIEKELERAETAVSQEERERLQGETLKLVFILYFNILKERVAKLIGPTLEGLARFAHLVNADLFGDLLEVIRELVVERQKRLVDGQFEFRESATREAMLCISTAFALLYAQTGESMNLDLTFFINHFYSSLPALAMNPDIEFSHKTLRLADPLKAKDEDAKPVRPHVNISTETEMMVRAFESIFFKQKSVSRLRVQAFAKRLAIAMMHFPEKSTIASLRILDKMNKKFTITNSLYSTEDRVANGLYHMEVDEPEQSNPEAATIWETVILEKHYDPTIASAVKSVVKGVTKR
ncbi:nucleolar complex-associated protein 3 [Trichomonascus vanleenenianus]|uniref:Noc3p n=1 Tax=Trichomonascus vanleenenianus TaxID=2268995 RepID=UPI003ECBAA29